MNALHTTLEPMFQFDPEDLEYFQNYTGITLNSSTRILLNSTRSLPSNHLVEPMCRFGYFQDQYKSVHGYLSIVVCVLGTLFNLLNILVLTHKDLRGNPINLILTGIAVADILVMIEYIPFTVHMYLLEEESRAMESKYSYVWGVFTWVHANFSIIIHTVSIWLTLSLAIWRYIMIKHHVLAITLCTIPRCKAVMSIGYVIPIILTIPNFLAMSLHEDTVVTSNRTNVTIYLLQWSSLAEANNKLLYRLNVWFYSFFLKLVPCVVLTMFTGLLVKALYKAEENSKRIKNGNLEAQQAENLKRGGNSMMQNGKEAAGGEVAGKVISRRKRATDRTTRLLIVILILFLVTEVPQGILGVMSAILGEKFFLDCYTPLGEMMDIMALLNCSINFVLFCLMSQQFRITFNKVLRLKEGMNRISFGRLYKAPELEAIPLSFKRNRENV